jgi:hypothetical protein
MNNTRHWQRLESDRTSSVSDQTSTESARWSGFGWLVGVGLIAVTLCLPFIRYVGWLGDEGVILHGAERALRGGLTAPALPSISR